MKYERWLQLMEQFKLKPNQNTYNDLLSAYSEKHRHYHTIDHIDALLMHFDNAIDLANHPREMEMAIWFHDAVYKPFSSTNELDSANWASTFLSNNKLPENIAETVHQLIMATRHTVEVSGSDESLLVDIDLTILGAPADVYDGYEKAIRKEYKLVPSMIYRKKRKLLLHSFLDRDRIYLNQFFYKKFEKQARSNMKRAITAL